MFDLSRDLSQPDNVADVYPERLHEMQALEELARLSKPGAQMSDEERRLTLRKVMPCTVFNTQRIDIVLA